MNTSDYIKKPKGYWDNYENCKKAFNSCKNTKELIKRFGGVVIIQLKRMVSPI